MIDKIENKRARDSTRETLRKIIADEAVAVLSTTEFETWLAE